MSSEKTEQPTEKKLRDARRRGEVPKSRELVAAIGLLGAVVGLVAFSGRLVDGLSGQMRAATMTAADPSREALVPALATGLSAGLALIAPIVAVVMAASVAAAYVQVGGLFAFESVLPRLERLDPSKSLRRIFGKQAIVELVKSLAILAIVGFVASSALIEARVGISRATALTPDALLVSAGKLLLDVAFRVAFALLALGVLDLFYQRYRHRQDQRMSKDEVKREAKEAEGDPRAKQHRARMHQEIVEHGALEEVRGADVLVINPTHYAVALRFDYESDQEAPEVRAKGVDHLARRMIDAAYEAGVPVMRDVPLARALYELDIGEQIPEALYEAVAAVLQAALDERNEASGSARDPGGALR